MQVVLADVEPIPPGPAAVTVQFCPAESTLSSIEPEQARAPEPGDVPVHKYVHEVAPIQFHSTLAFPPHAGLGPNEPVHCGMQ